MIKPAVFGRRLIAPAGCYSGVTLGYSDLDEHNVDVPRSDMFRYIDSFSPFSGQRRGILSRLTGRKGYSDDGDYDDYDDLWGFSRYILDPSTSLYKTEIVIDNSNVKAKTGLKTGGYTLVCIGDGEGGKGTKRFISGIQDGVPEFDVVGSNWYTDYGDYYFPRKFMASWGFGDPLIVMIAHVGSPYCSIVDNIERTLKSGYLALVPNIFGCKGMNFLFLDRLCLGREIYVS